MKSDYHERKENQLEAFERLADKNENESKNRFKQADNLASVIPMGQPILVGHHSERMHRNHLKKIDNNMRKGFEHSDKAAYYKGKVQNILEPQGISSDDPNAIEQLQAKLERLEGLQELMKDANRVIRGKGTDAEKVAALVTMEFTEVQAMELLSPTRFGGPGYQGFRMTNNNATIRNTRQRIEQLQKIESMEETEEVINGCTLKTCPDDNRVKIFFPGKPSEEIRKNLKGSGFRWSPREGAWMRMITNSAIWSGRDIIKNYPPCK